MKKDEKAVKDIIARYGDTINLRKTPYVIVEIIRQFGPVLGGGGKMDCAPPGGPPDILNESILVEELARKSAELSRISAALKKIVKQRSRR